MKTMKKFFITIVKKDNTVTQGVIEQHSPIDALDNFIIENMLNRYDFKSIFVSNITD